MSETVASSAVLHKHREEDDAVNALERIQDALRGLRYGTVTVIVQDAVVVQVERTEKLRLLRRER